ncbi:MAG TPA: hypothetical protein VH247_08805 [Thermoleophilaceae bacterium]|nr:hypothetical protein [Thermoleophilaceae bacterium]
MAKRPNVRPWAIAGALIVIAGVVAGLITGGGTGDTSGTYKTLAAADTEVSGVHYRVIATTPATAPKQGPVPLYFDEYTGNPPKLAEHFAVAGVGFYADSVIASLKLAGNPDRTATLTFSWFHHAGDRTSDTRRYRVTPHGIQLY